MSINAGSVYSELVLDVSKFNTGMMNAERQMQGFASKMQSYGKQMSNLGSTLTKKVTLPVVGLATAAGTIVAAFGWKRLTGLDSAQAQLKGLGMEMEDVDRISKQVSAAVQGTTMTMAEGTSAAAGALAAGIKEGAELERYIKLVGSAAVGANRPIADMAMIFNRVQGAGKLMTQELNMIEQGMPGFAQAMANSLGVPQAEFRKMVTEGKISSGQFLDVMDDFAGGMADAYANSWEGMVSNTKANIGIIGEHLLGGVFEQSKESIGDFLTLLRSDAAKTWAAEVGQKIGEAFLRIVEGVKSAASWYTNLDDGTKKVILTFGAMVVAIGPLLTTFGPLVGLVSSLITGLGAMSATIASGAGVMAGLTAGFPALGAAITLATGPVGLAAAAIAGLVVGGVALYKHLKSDSIPAVELFGDEVSEATAKAVNGFLDLENDATVALNQLNWSGQEVTGEMAVKIAGNFTEMASQVQAGLDKHHQESLAKIQGFVTGSTSLSKAEQDEILNNMRLGYENRKQTVAGSEARIKEILDIASSEKRALTKTEQEEINAIQKTMVETGIQVLSENEVEAKAIMERMKAQAGEITALQAAEVVKNSMEQRDGAIKAANEQYDQVVKEIIRQRDEAGIITKDQANRLILEATRQKNESVKKAEEMHENVIKEAKAQAREHINQVDWETGEIKTKWQIMKADISQKAKDIKEDVAQKWEEIKKKTAEEWTGIWEDTKRAWNDVKTEIADCTRGALGAAVESWINLKKTTAEKWDEIKTAIGSTLTNIISGIIQSGKDMVTGLWDGMNEKIGWLKDKLRSFVSDVISTIKGALGIKSPSREMAVVGEAIVQGLAVGITKDAGAPATALASIGAGLASLAMNMAGSVVKGFAAGSGDFHVAAMGDPSTWPVSGAVMFVQPDGSKLPSVISGTGVHMDPGQMDKYQSNWDSYIRSGGGGGGSSSYSSSSGGRGTGEYSFGQEVTDHGSYYDVPGIGHIEKKGDGGIATRARLSVWGEAGPEALLPLERLQPMMTEAMLQAIEYAGSFIQPAQIDWPRLEPGETVSQSRRQDTPRGGITQNLTINSPTPLTPSEVARKNLQMSRQLAMEWGV